LLTKNRDAHSNFHFLQHVHEEFTKLYRFNRINTAHAYSLDNTFAPVLRSAIHYHNLHHKELSQDVKVQKIQAKVDNLQSVMGRNISLILDNQQKMEKLLVTSEVMREDALVFRRKAKVTLLGSKKKNWFVTFGIIIVVMLGIYLAVLGVCGEGLTYCRAAAAAANSQNSNYNGGQPYNSSSTNANDDGGSSSNSNSTGGN
jgi:hypothetical protein